MSQWVQAAGYAEDLQSAYDYYKNKAGSVAAERFLFRYREGVLAITAHPRGCAVRRHGWRQKPIPHSTYSVFYGERGPFWLLVGIQSTVQDPDRIQALLLIREVSASPE